MLPGVRSDLFEKSGVGILPDGIIAVQPVFGQNLKTCPGKAFLNIEERTGIHLAGTGAALDRMPRAAAVKRDFTGARKGQFPAALQKQGAFRRQSAQLLQMLPFVVQKLIFHTESSFAAFLFFHYSRNSKRRNAEMGNFL